MPRIAANTGPRNLRRRDVIRAGAAVAGSALLAPAVTAAAADPEGHFRHGVASGDPLPHGVLLWTRVTPTEDATPGSGAGPQVTVGWQVSNDAEFTQVVASGSRTTGPEFDHTVKADIDGLSPDRWYYYRFEYDGDYSYIGRTRTAPADNVAARGLRFGVASCSNYQHGHFAAYRHLADRSDLDAIVHLGDYLYEYGAGHYGKVRLHQPEHEMVSLADYRIRHAQYKTDPDLQAAHAACPWIITWDDHESTNDAYDGGAKNHQSDTEGDWDDRYSAAFRAYHEWMPIRFGEGDTIYRRVRFGRLAEFTMLDLRTYRSQQATFDDVGEADESGRTITGPSQLEFLRDSLTDPDIAWKLIGNPVMFAPVTIPSLSREVADVLAEVTKEEPREGNPMNLDDWSGYQYERLQLVDYMAANQVRNAVFLTGDVHTSWANDVPADPGAYPDGENVATEFVVPSVTSNNFDDILEVEPRTVSPDVEAALMAGNAHLRWIELDSHGFGILDLTAARAQMDWYFLADREDPGSTAAHAKSFTVADGTARIEETPKPV